MTRRFLAVAAAGVLALSIAPSRASAQGAASGPDPAKVELAKRHFALGELYYNQGDYAKALAAFEESYALSRRDALLYNIGRCHEGLGELEKALRSFEAYAARTKDPDPNLRARIANLRARVAVRTPAPPPVAASSPAPAPSPTPEPEPTPAQPRSWIRPTAWILLGVGVAAIGTGAALGAMASSRASEVSEAYRAGNREWASVADTEASGKSLEKGAIASFVVGGVLVAGGAVLHILAPRRERRLAITPLIDGRTAGLTAGGRF